jgi:Tfp pilus assembly protein PilF
MATSKNTIEEWTVDGLINEITQNHDYMPDRALAFILGAGASISSGIPAGGHLAKMWLEEAYLRKCLDKKVTLENWAKSELKEPTFQLNETATYYSKIFELRFSTDPKSGYAALEAAMKDAEPSLGYSILAKILAETRHKVVVTTNFDNLVADALAIHALQHPLIVGHEALSGFVRPQMPRPLVAKIHRDLHLNPINDTNGVSQLGQGWTDALKGLFVHYTPLVIGYGGNDGSLMGFLSHLPTGHIPGRLFWCYHRSAKPSAQIQQVIAQHNGVMVAIEGFDEFILQLAEKLFPQFEASQMPADIIKLGEERAQRYQLRLDELLKNIAKASSNTDLPNLEKSRELMAKVSLDEDKWWTWELRADAEADLDKRDQIYRDAIARIPNSPELHGNYAIFLKEQRKDYAAAELMYKKALELAPGDADHTGNYANFLANQRKDYDAAELVYKKALELDPNHVNNTGNYAIFLEEQRKDYDAAELMFKKALEFDPDDADHTCNYANFLANKRKDYDAAELMHKKALELDPNNASITDIYANFLAQKRQEYDAAETLYKQALDLDPNDANIIANFISLLICKNDKASLDSASQLILRAITSAKGEATQTVAEVFLYACLLAELGLGHLEQRLGQLKGLLRLGFERGVWDFSLVFDAVLPKIETVRHDFYRTLGQAILDQNEVPALERNSIWRDIIERDPFVVE